jgi:hypothetical protein
MQKPKVKRPNHALQRTRASRSCSDRRASRPPSLNFIVSRIYARPVTHNQQLKNTMKNILCICLVLTVSLTALAAEKSDDHKAPNDQKSLQGEWIPVKAAENGEHFAPPA